MPGLNTTGKPNTADYNLGRGIVYFSPLDANDRPNAYRDLGNAPEFSVALESETLEHQSSRAGLKVTDKEVVISQKMTLSLTLDEINFQNLSVLFSGGTASHTNPSDANISKYDMYPVADGGVTLGRWYDLIKDRTGFDRLYDIQDATDLVFHETAGDVLLTIDVDYELDLKMGRIFLKSDATDIAATEGLTMTYTKSGSPEATVDEARALTATNVIGALKFVSENPAANDQQTEYQFHKVSLKAEGDFSLIGDEFTQMQFTAVAEKNETAGGSDSPTLTVRTFSQA